MGMRYNNSGRCLSVYRYKHYHSRGYTVVPTKKGKRTIKMWDKKSWWGIVNKIANAKDEIIKGNAKIVDILTREEYINLAEFMVILVEDVEQEDRDRGLEELLYKYIEKAPEMDKILKKHSN